MIYKDLIRYNPGLDDCNNTFLKERYFEGTMLENQENKQDNNND